MQILDQISEEEMIGSFLNGELDSIRFADVLRKKMDSLKIDRKIITAPDFSSQKENDLRKKLFAAYRGYGDNKELFEDFPNDIVWYRGVLTKDEILKVKYINYSYWNDLSDNTRLPTAAAKNIKRGYEAFHVENTNFLKAAEWLKDGNIFPELILVAKNPGADLVVLEGHVRLTAYALTPEYIPEPLKVIVGISQHIVDWPEYPDELSPITESRAQTQEIAEQIRAITPKHKQKIIAIDGGGGSGKSTLAKNIQKYLPESHIIHIDDFYIGPWDKRLDHTYYEVNPLFDWKRYEHEVLMPLQEGKQITYHVYDWHLHNTDRTISIPEDAIIIVEGGYTTQKDFADVYDFTIWVDVPEDVRLKRALARDGEHMRFLWEEDWLPIERNYMRVHNPKSQADVVINETGSPS